MIFIWLFTGGSTIGFAPRWSSKLVSEVKRSNPPRGCESVIEGELYRDRQGGSTPPPAKKKKKTVQTMEITMGNSRGSES